MTFSQACGIMYSVLVFAAIWGVCALPYMREARRLGRIRDDLRRGRPANAYRGRRNLRRIK